jgi:hypothetical protein
MLGDENVFELKWNSTVRITWAMAQKLSASLGNLNTQHIYIRAPLY